MFSCIIYSNEQLCKSQNSATLWAIAQTYSIKESIISKNFWGLSLGTCSCQLWGSGQPINLLFPSLLNGDNKMDLTLFLWGVNKTVNVNGQAHFVVLNKRYHTGLYPSSNIHTLFPDGTLNILDLKGTKLTINTARGEGEWLLFIEKVTHFIWFKPPNISEKELITLRKDYLLGALAHEFIQHTFNNVLGTVLITGENTTGRPLPWQTF